MLANSSLLTNSWVMSLLNNFELKPNAAYNFESICAIYWHKTVILMDDGQFGICLELVVACNSIAIHLQVC